MQSDNAKEFKPVAGDKLDTLYTNAKIKLIVSTKKAIINVMKQFGEEDALL